MRRWSWVGDLLNAVVAAAALCIVLLTAPLSALSPGDDSAPINLLGESSMLSELIPADASESISFVVPEDISASWLILTALEKNPVRQTGLADLLTLAISDPDILPAELPGQTLPEFWNPPLLRDKSLEARSAPETQTVAPLVQLTERP